MAKVFRLTEGANLDHWGDSNEYNSLLIDSIGTKDGEKTRKEPTSIPSPFARLDLINTAFRVVSEKRELDGVTVYHKMVSDVLDLLEISFNVDAIQGLSISYWDKNANLNTLLNSNNPKHRLYGETLKLYLNQDNKSFNFDDFNGFYIFKYQHKIIGGTSPLTMFFTSANDLSFANISLGNGDILFDADYCPLYKRDEDFIKYIVSLFNSSSVLKEKMRYFYEYIVVTLSKLNSTNFQLFNELKSYTESDNYLSKCKQVDTGVPGQIIEIFGIPLYKRSGEMPIEEESEFIIQSERFKSLYSVQKLPLVLQNNFNKKLKYTSASHVWDSNISVPFVDQSPLEDRQLPGMIMKYPYLTISDFLEPVIFQLDYSLNSSSFYSGFFKNIENSEIGYTLPLTKNFFDFFTIDDLMNKKINGNSMLEISAYPASVEVILRIPINGGKDIITFTRSYDSKALSFEDNLLPDLENNKGTIEKLDAAIAIYPFIQSDNIDEYRIGLFKTNDYSIKLNYFDFHNRTVLVKDTKERGSDKVNSQYSLLEDKFDYLTINLFGFTNAIIPIWKKQKASNDQFTFAIDFGTTNTHIEYQVGNSLSKSFEINESDIQFQSTINPKTTKGGTPLFISRCIELEMLPFIIDSTVDYNFPIRTAISHRKDLNKDLSTYPLMDFSIPFTYQKRNILKNNIVKTNLKWDGLANVEVEKYLEELILLMKHKVVFNNGDLKATVIKWSYPLSMSKVRLNRLERIFNDLIEKHFGNQVETHKYSESLAPFQYLSFAEGITSLNRPVASIDMGGGTVDMVIYYKNEPELITSFKLGVNTIFGNGYNKSNERNGFNKIYDSINLNGERLNSLAKRLGEGSIDMVDLSIFAFSLENNKELKDRNINFSFIKTLSDSGDYLIIFLLYYSSIIYHLAKVMKVKELDAPKSITFSGNGSKILDVIDPSKKSNILRELTEIIFTKVYSDEVEKISIEKYPNPKEMTAKGMIHADKNYDTRSLIFTLLGDKENTNVASYDNIDKYVDSTINEFNDFIELFFGLNKEFSFTDNFEISQSKLNEMKDFIKDEMKDELLLGINDRLKELNGETESQINESLFFYPLVGILSGLATFISDSYEN
ncbi:hypothetical protein OBK16_12000 [Empedobacter falsenii]|uniref:hypothetical protein n=1 Tax=Empedobacter falsenii TaxID=343874 RepID=UPI000570B1FA|nr:hypothetical protein [Empedobacter falsenii]